MAGVVCFTVAGVASFKVAGVGLRGVDSFRLAGVGSVNVGLSIDDEYNTYMITLLDHHSKSKSRQNYTLTKVFKLERKHY